MLRAILFWYIGIALGLFLVGVVVGKLLRQDVLGGGVRLGIFNSLLLAVIWPITGILALVGLGYEIVRVWKKI